MESLKLEEYVNKKIFVISYKIAIAIIINLLIVGIISVFLGIGLEFLEMILHGLGIYIPIFGLFFVLVQGLLIFGLVSSIAIFIFLIYRELRILDQTKENFN